MKVITLWQPWATWVILGWKTIETRLHPRFASLEGQTIGIHAALKYDPDAYDLAKPYLDMAQRIFTKSIPPSARGVILGTVDVREHRLLSVKDSQKALIDCEHTKRYGLILENRKPFDEQILVRGKQRIWNIDDSLIPAKYR